MLWFAVHRSIFVHWTVLRCRNKKFFVGCDFDNLEDPGNCAPKRYYAVGEQSADKGVGSPNQLSKQQTKHKNSRRKHYTFFLHVGWKLSAGDSIKMQWSMYACARSQFIISFEHHHDSTFQVTNKPCRICLEHSFLKKKPACAPPCVMESLRTAGPTTTPN